MVKYLKEILSDYSETEIVQMCKAINKNYNIYDPEEVRLVKISYVLNKTSAAQIDRLKRHAFSNEVVNDLIFNYYFCERVIKYYFVRHLMSRSNHIVAFEMVIGESRIDICRINGQSYAYEIKTQYDTFDRLGTQMRDYLKTFEKVYVIVPSNRVSDVRKYIPESCGIISYRVMENKEVIFSYKKKAQKNVCKIEQCIESLSSNDLSQMLKLVGKDDHQTRSEKIMALLQITHRKPIWSQYRQVLKQKYGSQWNFLVNHFDEILPMDVQTFYSANINPQLLYCRKSERE